MKKIVFGNENTPVLSRGKTLKEAIGNVKEYLVNECLEDLNVNNMQLRELYEERRFDPSDEDTIDMIGLLEEANEETEDMIDQICKCKSIATLNDLPFYDIGWSVRELN